MKDEHSDWNTDEGTTTRRNSAQKRYLQPQHLGDVTVVTGKWRAKAQLEDFCLVVGGRTKRSRKATAKLRKPRVRVCDVFVTLRVQV